MMRMMRANDWPSSDWPSLTRLTQFTDSVKKHYDREWYTIWEKTMKPDEQEDFASVVSGFFSHEWKLINSSRNNEQSYECKLSLNGISVGTMHFYECQMYYLPHDSSLWTMY